MNRTAKRAYWGFVAVPLALTFGLGCSPLTGLWMLRDDGKVPAQYKLDPKDGRKEVVVAVLVSTSPEIATNPKFATLDRDLALAIGNSLGEETAKEKVKVTAVEQAVVERLRSLNPEKFNTAARGELLRPLRADYLLEVNVTDFGLYGSGFGTELPQGHAGVEVTVYEDGAVNGAKKYDYPFGWEAPQRATGDIPARGYQRWFVAELGKRIAQRHVKHTADRERGMFQKR